MKFFMETKLFCVLSAFAPAHEQSLRGGKRLGASLGPMGTHSPAGGGNHSTLAQDEMGRQLSGVDPCNPLRWTSAATREEVSREFSEEERDSGKQAAPIAGNICSDDFCDNKRLVAIRYGNERAVKNSNVWTGWFTDGGGSNYRACPRDMVVNEIRCKGRYCDDMRLSCGRMESGYRVDRSDTMEVGWFSEEEGKRLCRDGYYIVGMGCNDDFCDEIRLTCAKVYKDETYSVFGEWMPQFTVVGDSTVTITHGTTKTTEFSKSREWTSSVTATVESGLEVGGVGSASASLSRTVSSGISSSFRHEWAEEKEEEFEVFFGEEFRGHYLWQWVFEISDPTGETVLTKTKEYAATDGRAYPPRCPPGHSVGRSVDYQHCDSPDLLLPGFEETTVTAPTPSSPAPPTPVSADGGFCNWGLDGTAESSTCQGGAQGGIWCNENEDQCTSGCGGRWCSSASPSGFCNWGADGTAEASTCQGGAQGGSWCNANEDQCTSGCGGRWCTA